jgi:hypothetical protein
MSIGFKLAFFITLMPCFIWSWIFLSSFKVFGIWSSLSFYFIFVLPMSFVFKVSIVSLFIFFWSWSWRVSGLGVWTCFCFLLMMKFKKFFVLYSESCTCSLIFSMRDLWMFYEYDFSSPLLLLWDFFGGWSWLLQMFICGN